jgi:MarR family 2-MHQ and catechol resistance regulon transcriptional repressor
MATAYKGTDEETVALDAYIKLMRATAAATARIHGHLADEDLTQSQFGVLEMLFHLGPLSQGSIGQKLLKSGGNVTLVLDNLEKRGLVRRERHAPDRRHVIVSLTDKGHALIQCVFPRHVAAIVQEMNALTRDEQIELARLCRKLGLQVRYTANG